MSLMKEFFIEAIDEILMEDYPIDTELYDLPKEVQDKVCDRALDRATDKFAGWIDYGYERWKEKQAEEKTNGHNQKTP